MPEPSETINHGTVSGTEGMDTSATTLLGEDEITHVAEPFGLTDTESGRERIGTPCADGEEVTAQPSPTINNGGNGCAYWGRR